MTTILGISCYYHDSSASLIKDGEIIAAVQEERLTRVKHDSRFPKNSIEYVCKEGGLKLNEIDYIVFYEKPFLKFERLLETYLKNAPRGFLSFLKSMPLWIKEKIFQKKIILEELQKIEPFFKLKNKLLFSSHHLSHASSAFYPSPFEKSLILTLDGVGEWATTTIAVGNNNKIEMKEEIIFPDSLGLIYSAFTYYCGFKVNDGEYKLMGLAPYGEPKYSEIIKKSLLKIYEDGSIKINMKYFSYDVGLTMTNSKFEKLFKNKRRDPKNQISKFYMDMAASVQLVLEEIMIKICKYIKQKYKIDNLCLAGGVALNCVANGKIVKEKIFKNIWVQPASSDAGGSLGAAMSVWYEYLKNVRDIDNSNENELFDNMKGSLLGPKYSNDYIKKFLEDNKIKYEFYNKDILFKKISKIISEKKIIGLFQGRMEFGPRALGSRSIIGDPRDPEMQKKMNLKIKYRESFRPFAPMILKDYLNKYFDFDFSSPYMLMVSKIKDKFRKEYPTEYQGFKKLEFANSIFPSITHVDYSARLQTIDKSNGYIYELLKTFNQDYDCPLLINTSFNIKDEPIVDSPENAFKCFMSTEIDALVLENFIIRK